MSRRNSNAMRKDNRKHYQNHSRDENKTYYSKESKTIDFNQSQPRRTIKKPVELIPQTVGQEKYIIALTNPSTDIVLVSGPAGTGKTYLAVLAAVKAMKQGDCHKLILSRPSISVESENHGFLPGDLNSKLEPWVRPLMDVLSEFYTATELEYFLKEKIIEFAPLGMMRGRSFKNTWLICDEMQNGTPEIFKMVLTRIGENSRIIIAGDIEQTDRQTANNGLLDIGTRLIHSPINGIEHCVLTEKDVRRHKLIPEILKLYR